MSIRQKLATPLRRGSMSLPAAPAAPGATSARPIPASIQTSNLHTSAPVAAPMATPITSSSAGSSEPGAGSHPTLPGSGASAAPLLWKASSPAVETWWGTRPCPIALGTPTGIMFDGPARAQGPRPHKRWDFEDSTANTRG